MADLQAAIDALYATPLEDFVTERTRLARELRGAGDRGAAAELAKLAKPSAAAWALNHVARTDPAAVETWLEAAAQLREASAHAAEVGGDAIRTAMAAHRDATARLTAVVEERARPAGRALSASMLDRVRSLLQAATVDAVLAERLRAGHVSEQAAASTGPPPVPTAVPPRRREPDPQEVARAERRERLRREADQALETLERVREELAARAAAAATADERLEEARRTLTRTQSEADAAHDAVEDAEAAVASAEAELQRLRDLAREA